MDRIVTDYGAIPRVRAEIDGTAAFPGGTGLWRGFEPFGALPEFVPTLPFFVLAHNFDSVASYERSIVRGCEKLDSTFWAFLLLYLAGAKIDPAECFISNAFLGLQSGSAQGPVRGGGPLFASQCLRFIEHEIDITKPRLGIVLGDITARFVRRIDTAVPFVAVRHPSSFVYVKNAMKQNELETQIERIAAGVGRGTAPVRIPSRYLRNDAEC